MYRDSLLCRGRSIANTAQVSIVRDNVQILRSMRPAIAASSNALRSRRPTLRLFTSTSQANVAMRKKH